MYQLSLKEFENIVGESYDSLTEKIKLQLHNVVIMVANMPNKEQLESVGRRANEYDLFGLFEGYAQAKRLNFGPVLPDKITLFKQPILKYCSNLEEVKQKVLSTLKHEIAHHFGSDEVGAEKASKNKANL